MTSLTLNGKSDTAEILPSMKFFKIGSTSQSFSNRLSDSRISFWDNQVITHFADVINVE